MNTPTLVEQREWLKDRLSDVVNEITDLGWGTDTDNGQRLLLEEAGKILLHIRRTARLAL